MDNFDLYLAKQKFILKELSLNDLVRGACARNVPKDFKTDETDDYKENHKERYMYLSAD